MSHWVQTTGKVNADWLKNQLCQQSLLIEQGLIRIVFYVSHWVQIIGKENAD